MNFDDFAKRIHRIAVRVEGNVVRAVKDCAGAVLRSVIGNTPVDTGYARSNWTPELDRAFVGLSPARVPGERGSTAAENAAATIEAGTPTIEAFEIIANREIHITNNAPHIQPLNNGHSKQAPAGFVQVAGWRGCRRCGARGSSTTDQRSCGVNSGAGVVFSRSAGLAIMVSGGLRVPRSMPLT